MGPYGLPMGSLRGLYVLYGSLWGLYVLYVLYGSLWALYGVPMGSL